MSSFGAIAETGRKSFLFPFCRRILFPHISRPASKRAPRIMAEAEFSLVLPKLPVVDRFPVLSSDERTSLSSTAGTISGACGRYGFSGDPDRERNLDPELSGNSGKPSGEGSLQQLSHRTASEPLCRRCGYARRFSKYKEAPAFAGARF